MLQKAANNLTQQQVDMRIPAVVLHVELTPEHALMLRLAVFGEVSYHSLLRMNPTNTKSAVTLDFYSPLSQPVLLPARMVVASTYQQERNALPAHPQT